MGNLNRNSHWSNLSWADGLLLTAFFWGVNFAVVKFALAEIPPLVFNGLRFVVAASTMLILARQYSYVVPSQK